MNSNNSTATEQTTHFFKAFPSKSLSAGSVFISPDHKTKEIYYLESGLVKMYTVTDSGTEQIHTIFKPGTFFPLMSLLTRKPNHYYFETLEASHFFLAPATEVITFLQHNATVTYDLLARLYTGLDGYMQHVDHYMSGTALEKLSAIITTLAKRFGVATAQGIEIHKLTTHQELANMAGLSRETVSRVLSRLQKEQKIIKDGKKIIVRDNLLQM